MALSSRISRHRFLSNNPLLHHRFSFFSSSSHDDSSRSDVEKASIALEAARKHLSQFSKSQSSNSSQPSDSSQPISLQDSYHRSVTFKPVNGTSPPAFSIPNRPASGQFNFAKIRDSLKLSKLDGKNRGVLRGGTGNVGAKSNVIDGTQGLPASRPGRVMNIKHKSLSLGYNNEKLGEKLRSLRPVHKTGEKGWFSLQELSERLEKLEEEDSHISGLDAKDLGKYLKRIRPDDEEDVKRHAMKLHLLGKIGSTTPLVELPPKENLIEKYLHPDNMSTAEKMKIELAKVRDEFKISESDCGSARVQVAQLTTKIKHLSAVLHKKDKHSRKGLQDMVQRRKKLLKYLRRTDWDSYCFVISKLGLRDNPEFKESHKRRLS